MDKNRIVSFVWQHILLLFSLFIMTLGVALCVQSQLGSSVISSLPYVFECAGTKGTMPALTIGQYTYIMNAVFVLLQIAILRRQFEAVQFFQLLIGFVFGSLIDLNMLLTSMMVTDWLPGKIILQIAGCTVMGFGISLEVRCGSVTMPGEGLPVAISRVTSLAFSTIKIGFDIFIVVCAIRMLHILWTVVMEHCWHRHFICHGIRRRMCAIFWQTYRMV